MTKAGSPYDAIVVGGGHNGLVAAGYLAAAGQRVLVLERRSVVGGPCGAFDYFPGYRAAVANSPGSLEPKVAYDLELERHGLRYVRPNPSLVYPFPGERRFVGWRERDLAKEQLEQFSAADAANYAPFFHYVETFARKLGVNLFDRPPTWRELTSRLTTAEDEDAFAKFMFGSVWDMLDDWFVSHEVKALIASGAVVNNFAGTRTPGTPVRLLHRPWSLHSSATYGGHDPRHEELRGSTGLPLGGLGAIAEAMSRSLRSRGGEIRTESAVVRIVVEAGRCRGVELEDGTVLMAPVVLSNLNPRTTFLDLVDPVEAERGDSDFGAFRAAISRMRMRGTAFKIGLALDGIPRYAGVTDEDEARTLASCQFRIAPTMEYMERAFDDAKYGRWSQGPLLWGLTPSVMDPSLTPEGKHVMSISVFHAPYHLSEGSWETERDRFGARCIETLTEYIPNLPDIITDTRYLSPVDLENEFGLVEGNITHGDMLAESMFAVRPAAGWSNYATPVAGLYLCGSGAWPGGLISGLPGHNAARRVLADLA